MFKTKLFIKKSNSMSKKMLYEIFDIKSGKMKKKDGTTTDIIYIDPKTSENTYQYKDKIKNDFGAL